MPRIAIMPLLILILLLAGIVITFVALRKRGKTALLVFLVVGIAGLVLAMFTFRVASVSRVSVQSISGVTRQNTQHNYKVASLPIWSEGMDGQFSADVYPSLKAAALGLARQTVQDLESFLSDTNNKDALHVYGEPTEGQGLTQEAIDAFVGRLRESLGPRTLALSEQAPLNRAAPDAVTVWLKQPRWTVPASASPSGRAEGVSAKLGVTISDADRSTSRTTEFMLKPWVDSFSDFVNRRGHRPGQYKVARSYDTCTDEAEALDQALTQACAQVKEAISRLNGSLQEAYTVDFRVTPQDLDRARIVEDSFAQSFQGTVGKIWRHALLLDFSTDKLVGLRQVKIKQAHRAHLTFARLAGSALGLAFLIFILYIFLNAATKGYYTIALRTAALLLILMVGAVVFFLG